MHKSRRTRKKSESFAKLLTSRPLLLTPGLHGAFLQLARGATFLPYVSVVLKTMESDGKTLAAAMGALSAKVATDVATSADLTRRYLDRLAELASFLARGVDRIDIALATREDHAEIMAAVEAKAADPSATPSKDKE